MKRGTLLALPGRLKEQDFATRGLCTYNSDRRNWPLEFYSALTRNRGLSLTQAGLSANDRLEFLENFTVDGANELHAMPGTNFDLGTYFDRQEAAAASTR